MPLILILLTLVLSIKTHALDCPKVLTNGRPERVHLQSISKNVTLGTWLNLENLKPKKFDVLFNEIIRGNYLIELPSGNRGLVGRAERDGPIWSVRIKSSLRKGGLVGAEVVRAPKLDRKFKIRILAKSAKLPNKSVAILASDIQRSLDETGLSAEDQNLLRTHSKAVMTYYEFLTSSKFKNKNKKIIILGNDWFLYRKLAEARNYEVFDTLYDQYYKNGQLEDLGTPWDPDTGPTKEITDQFMYEALTDFQVIFFLPSALHKQAHIYGKGQGGYTFEEWQWLKERPHLMKEVVFVVGDHEALVPGMSIFTESGTDPAYEKRDREILELLRDPVPYLIHY